mgnify:FL=1
MRELTMREKLRQRRKERRLRTLRLFAIFALVAAVYAGIYHYLHRPDFTYGSVSIHGTKCLSEEDVLRLAESKAPFNMFNVDADKVEEALRHDVRFKTVHAEYKWPGVLHINVQERRPALYVENAYQGYAKLGYCGTVMVFTSGIPDDNAPMLTGVDCGSLYISDVVENKNVLSVLNFLNSIDITAHEQFTEIDIDKENNVRVQLKIGFPILLGPVAELKDKTELFMTVFNEIKGKKIVAEYIDLTYSKPYIRLKSKAEEAKK